MGRSIHRVVARAYERSQEEPGQRGVLHCICTNTALWPVPREGYSTWKTAPMTPEPDPEPEPEPWRVKASRALSARTTPDPSWYVGGT